MQKRGGILMESREIKLAKGTLRTYRNAQILHTIGFGSISLVALQKSPILVGAGVLGFILSAHDTVLRENKLIRFNKAPEATKDNLINQIIEDRTYSNSSSKLLATIYGIYAGVAIINKNIIGAICGLTLLSVNLAYIRADSLHTKLVIEHEKVKTLQK